MRLFTVEFLACFMYGCFTVTAFCTYTVINTKKHQVVFNYFNESPSEKGLPECDKHSACNILHKRFWMPPIADRLCRCDNKIECSWKWNDDAADELSMFIDNRSQLKFCNPLVHPICTKKQKALTVRKTTQNGTLVDYTIEAWCRCPKEHYWKRYRTLERQNYTNNSTFLLEEYKCLELGKCEPLQFCGNARVDYSSVYYQCSCPKGHLCIYTNLTRFTGEELLYKGDVYKAVCQPMDKEGRL